MDLPNLDSNDVKNIIPTASNIGSPIMGGQKLVFPCEIGNKIYMLKFMLKPSLPTGNQIDEQPQDSFDLVSERAKREVQIMGDCNSPYLVKLGPIPLTEITYQNQSLLYFSEERIEGQDLSVVLKSVKTLAINEVVKLARNINEAIGDLWRLSKIHRDIKPGNIVQRSDGTGYVLLDFGLAFDVADISLTSTGILVGTVAYLSPEQTNVSKRREMDYRSDLFLLGIVLYQALTGSHPFKRSVHDSVGEIISNISSYKQPLPESLRPDTPPELSKVITRLLAKEPNLRYRSCDALEKALSKIPSV